MSITEQWINTEERLLGEADSFGDFLEQLRDRVSPTLIGDREWEKILERARDLPVTMAAFPFGFELPLHEPGPRADLGVSVIGGSRSAEYFESKGRARDADRTAAAIAGLLGETEPEDSALRRIADRKMLLEYDIGLMPRSMQPEPGIFLYPSEQTLVGDRDSQHVQDLGIVVDAVASTAGWDMSAAERRQIEQVYMAMTPDTSVRAVGAFPSRERRIRLAVTGFRKTHDVLAFLERVGWSGRHSTLASTLLPLEEREAFAHMGVHLDVNSHGLGPMTGLSFFAREGQWLKEARHWIPLIDGIREAQIAIPEKLSEVANWSCGSEALSGKSGTFVLVRGIHHIKFGLIGDQVKQVKAYVFLLIFAWPLT